MTESSHFTSPVVRVVPAEGIIPGLYDVQLADGTWRYDLTQGQVRYLTDVIGGHDD